MNTREKIVTCEEALRRLPAEKPASLVVGYFDPMLAAHVEGLAGLDGPVWIAVADPPEPLYPLASRLDLVAALRNVCLVFPYDGGPGLESASVLDVRPDHLRLREHFLQHVRAKHA